MSKQSVNGFLVTVDNIEHTVGEARLFQQLRKLPDAAPRDGTVCLGYVALANATYLKYDSPTTWQRRIG